MTYFFRKSNMALRLVSVVLVMALSLHADDAERKLKTRINPVFPDLAKKMNVSGTVRLEVMVSSAGQVKSIRPLGGHPLLIDAAQNAVKQWRYEPGPEGQQIVEIHFTNQ